MKEKLYLGIETSCDDTSCAVYSPDRGVIAHRTAAQLDHEKYGGVVPEIASRSHMRSLLPLYSSVMEDAGIEPISLSGIAVTNGPGLTGSLLVGLSFAKALAYGFGIPLTGVHHLEGHILANALTGEFVTPSVVLVVSGGHSQLIKVDRPGLYEFLGGTRDDAAGEAFDKIAKMLGLPYPGGPSLEKTGKNGNRNAYDFPRALKNSGKCDLSFSGLKTSVRLKFESIEDISDKIIADIAASAQEAIVDILAIKSKMAVEESGVKRFYIAGGVAANQRLRDVMLERLGAGGIKVSWPEMRYCTDNAAMIACAGYYHFSAGKVDGLELNTFPRGGLGSWVSE
ncbi:MAG: tRNA (adenosine(37)-N6)-threonylcarbamoyltransferase complex transferase subunit TsaD [Candidatus Krumholzibacteriota bacterium]|nr:tRNA (adenosine(37)-N6)-threonylcarbamoyltransferase complex transferase subunit TsaD [Candidatus Krumholzibacteriota bacterium]